MEIAENGGTPKSFKSRMTRIQERIVHLMMETSFFWGQNLGGWGFKIFKLLYPQKCTCPFTKKAKGPTNRGSS